MAKITLTTGKVVEVVDEYGFDETLRAAELSEAPADPNYADSILLNIASVMVAVKSIDGKSMEDVLDKAVKSKDMLKAFRKAFTGAEWDQLAAATSEFYKEPDAPKGKYVIEP